MGGEEEDAVAPSRGKIGLGSGSDSEKVGSKRSQEITKSIRSKISSDRKNG